MIVDRDDSQMLFGIILVQQRTNARSDIELFVSGRNDDCNAR